MEEERIITIQEELSKDFYAMTEVQIDAVLKNLKMINYRPHWSWKHMSGSEDGMKWSRELNR